MRYVPAEQLLGLRLELGAAHAGLSVADIMERFGVSRRTAERMLAAAGRLLPLEELDAWEDRRKRWRIKRLPPGPFRARGRRACRPPARGDRLRPRRSFMPGNRAADA